MAKGVWAAVPPAGLGVEELASELSWLAAFLVATRLRALDESQGSILEVQFFATMSFLNNYLIHPISKADTLGNIFN